MSEVPVWTCEMAKAEVELDQLTVGDRFALNCHGDIAVAWTADLPTTKFAKKDEEHSLDVLEAPSLQPQSAQLVVTGYRPGAHAPEYVRVMQGDRGFEFVKPKWKIGSVLDPQKPPEPAASLGPMPVGMPLWLPLSYVGFAALVFGLVCLFIYRFFTRRRFKDELRRLETALPPIREFYKDARGLRRRLEMASSDEDVRAVTRDMNHKFRVMLTREYEIPALQWTDKAITKQLERKRRPMMRVAGDALKKTLRELTRLVSRDQLNEADVDQTLRMAVDTAERLDRGAP